MHGMIHHHVIARLAALSPTDDMKWPSRGPALTGDNGAAQRRGAEERTGLEGRGA